MPTGGVRPTQAVVKGSKAKASSSPQGKPAAKRQARLDSQFNSDVAPSRSRVFKKIQDVQIPPIAAFNKLTSSSSVCYSGIGSIKRIIMKDKVLRGLPFQDLWPRILTGFPELNVIGRLITVAVISSLPIDTSSNERYFRLMNQLMGKQQTSMKHELLRNLMTWHDANRVLSPEQWKLAITKAASAWLRADHTKTGKRVFRKDKLKKKGWVAAVEAMADMASVVENTYDDLVVARILE